MSSFKFFFCWSSLSSCSFTFIVIQFSHCAFSKSVKAITWAAFCVSVLSVIDFKIFNLKAHCAVISWFVNTVVRKLLTMSIVSAYNLVCFHHSNTLLRCSVSTSHIMWLVRCKNVISSSLHDWILSWHIFSMTFECIWFSISVTDLFRIILQKSDKLKLFLKSDEWVAWSAADLRSLSLFYYYVAECHLFSLFLWCWILCDRYIRSLLHTALKA